MSKIFPLTKVGTRLLYKVRHHKGHGIHSPFVFNFITKVIEEKSEYNAYADVREYLGRYPDVSFRENKTHRLLFKIVNYFKLKNILELGGGDGYATLFLTVPSSEINCLSVEQSPEKFEKAKLLYSLWKRKIEQADEFLPIDTDKKDCIFVNLRNYDFSQNNFIPHLMSMTCSESVVILDGIRTNRKRKLLWKMLLQQDDVIVSLDLFHVGILFFNKKYFKRNFKLSF